MTYMVLEGKGKSNESMSRFEDLKIQHSIFHVQHSLFNDKKLE